MRVGIKCFAHGRACDTFAISVDRATDMVTAECYSCKERAFTTHIPGITAKLDSNDRQADQDNRMTIIGPCG